MFQQRLPWDICKICQDRWLFPFIILRRYEADSLRAIPQWILDHKLDVVKNVRNSERKCVSHSQVNDNQIFLHLFPKKSDGTKAVSRKIIDRTSKIVRSFISSQNKRICNSQVNSNQKFLLLWMDILAKTSFLISFLSILSLCSTCNPLIWNKPYFLHMKHSLYFGDNSLLFNMFY